MAAECEVCSSSEICETERKRKGEAHTCHFCCTIGARSRKCATKKLLTQRCAMTGPMQKRYRRALLKFVAKSKLSCGVEIAKARCVDGTF
jgi:hypothetical protein